MQSERRHELQENTLARELGTWSDRLRPYTSAILVAIAALLGVYIIASLWNSYQATRDRAAWDDYQLAVLEGDVEQKSLRRLADSEDHAGTEMQEWALIGWADRQLLRAAQLYLTNRDESIERVNDIIGVYDQFATSGANPEIRNRAQLGLARAFEMKGDVQQARAHYERVEGALSDVADQRLRELEGEQAVETAKWLATAELPKPTTPGGPGTPGARPGFEASLPSTDAASGAAEAAMSDIFGGLTAPEDATRYETPAETPAETSAAEADDSAGQQAPSEMPADDASAEPAPADGPVESPAPAAEDPAVDEVPATELPPSEAPAAEASEEPAAETPAEEAAADESAEETAAVGAPAEQ